MSVTPKQVLVVDDDPTLRKLLEYNFTTSGYAVAVACGVTEAMRIANQTQFDLIVTDYFMPLLSGGDLVRRLRQRGNYAKTPVIVMSAQREYVDMDYFDRDPLVVRFQKPFSIHKLIDTVANCLADPAVAS